MTAVPAELPVTMPELLPMTAWEEAEDQLPPAEASAQVADSPAQSVAMPVMGAGSGCTVMVAVTLQAPRAQLMTAVPLVIPVTAPEPDTEATAGLPLLQLQPGVGSERAMVAPSQTAAPEGTTMAAGADRTETEAVT